MSRKQGKLKRKIETNLVPYQNEDLKPQAADLRLMRLMRSVAFGEIENIEIKNGQPVNYRMAWKSEKL